ncbi:MAG: hypothetical protein LM580_09790, partial [Thermofilum sp.]|nr:hypothetical protein [Thermofilum sp.]
MPQVNSSKGVALFLLLLTVLSAVEPLLLRFAAPLTLGGLLTTASATPISEEEFVKRMTQWLHAQDQFLEAASKELGIKLREGVIKEGRRLGLNVGNKLAKNPADLEKAKQIIMELFQDRVLSESEYKQAMEYIASDRWLDFAIDEARVLKEGKIFALRRVGVEAKTAKTNKGEFVAELIRDMYNVLNGGDQYELEKVVVVYPDDPDLAKWVKGTVNAVAEKFKEKFGVENAGGALGEGALVECASETTFKQWLGGKVKTLIDFMSSTKMTILILLVDVLMSAALVNAPPQVLLANVSYNGYGNGFLDVTLTCGTGDWQGYRALYIEIGVWLKVNGSNIGFHLAHFYFPILLSDGEDFHDVAPVVVPSDTEPWIPLPSAPGLLYDGQRLRIEVPLKQYTVKETRPDGSVVEKTVMDTLVLDADVFTERLVTGDIFKSVIVKKALVDQLTLSQRLVNAPPPPSQATSVNPAPPTPYVTVKASVASGCGYVTIVPQLWFYPFGPEVSVPNGSLVALHAYPCEGCSLQYWLISDGQRTWTVTGTYVGLRVNRSLTALAYFTDPPKLPKLVLRAESSDGAPVYVNMSGWVLWTDYNGVIYNTTLPGDVIIGGLDFTLRHDTPLGFRVTANETAVWVGVPV